MPTVSHSHSPSAVRGTPDKNTTYGQIIEYIQDRLYLASYTQPPTAQTPFPYPSKQSKSPSKRSSKSFNTSASSTSSGPKVHPPTYFSIDRALLYNAFHADFGPLHIGHLYRFAVQLHEVLGDPDNEGRAVVFWSHADSRSRANAACILACYMILIQSWPPHLALAPIAQMDPPLMPFRDAGYSQADYMLNVQDVVYGVWKAKEEGLCALKQFDLEEYETFERVDMGDFNWLTPDFVAFASPQCSPTAVVAPSSPQYATLPTTIDAIDNANIPSPFKNVLAHFKSRDVGLVVRLNSELYSPSYFTALGIQHMDMIFEDGTCPPLSLVRKFIKLAHDMINVKHRGIAVHCKAGLGRTGCLIGAYLIYRHGFTANEVIAFMRFMRPGMVVGPQQHWLHLNQGAFREWWVEDAIKDKIALLKQSTPRKSSSPAKKNPHQRLASAGQVQTPPQNSSQKRAALGEIDDNSHRTASGRYAAVTQDENLPAPTPGQPRKTSKIYGDIHNPRLPSESTLAGQQQPETEIISLERHTRPTDDGMGIDESEEEYSVKLSRRISTSRSPNPTPSNKGSSITPKRSVSCTTTTTTTHTSWSNVRAATAAPTTGLDLEDSLALDDSINGIVSVMSPTAGKTKSPLRGEGKRTVSGAGSISVGKVRAIGNSGNSSPVRRDISSRSGSGSSAGVRKTSGRVGTVGAVGRGK